MRSRFSAALNGIPLDGLDERITVTNILESSPGLQLLTASLPSLTGSRVTGRQRRELRVTVEFVLRERDTVRRALLLDRIRAWAGDGILTVSCRPDQRLRVWVEKLPDMDALAWAGTMKVVFLACEVPFWEDLAETVFRMEGTGPLALPLRIRGTAALTPLDVTLINRGTEGLSSLTLETQTDSLRFDGLALLPGQRLLIRCSDGDFRAECEGEDGARPALRTADSSDWLRIRCGQADALQLQCSAPVEIRACARGRWL